MTQNQSNIIPPGFTEDSWAKLTPEQQQPYLQPNSGTTEAQNQAAQLEADAKKTAAKQAAIGVAGGVAGGLFAALLNRFRR